LPALIRKFHEESDVQQHAINLWGSGTPRREFLHSSDLAKAVIYLLENYDNPVPINVGTGSEVSIAELAELIRTVSGYKGDLNWDTSKPDGTPRKVLDVSRISGLGWHPEVTLEAGISSTYSWYSLNKGMKIGG